jgi:DNA-binding GntR family transcriptional regulator
MERVEVRVDRSSPVPLYFQASQQLEAAIRGGMLRPGARLANENQLAAEWGLSRPTVRQAIQHLVDQGLLVRKRGVGTQVVQPQVVRRSLELTSLHDDLVAAGQRPRTEVLECTRIPASPEVAKELALAPGTEVIRLHRLRHTGDQPLALMTNYLPGDLLPLTCDQLTSEGLYAVLRSAGINLRIAHQTIGARPASATEAELLSEPVAAPLLTMTRTAYDDKGRAVEHGSHIYRATRYAFTLTLVER